MLKSDAQKLTERRVWLLCTVRVPLNVVHEAMDNHWNLLSYTGMQISQYIMEFIMPILPFPLKFRNMTQVLHACISTKRKDGQSRKVFEEKWLGMEDFICTLIMPSWISCPASLPSDHGSPLHVNSFSRSSCIYTDFQLEACTWILVYWHWSKKGSRLIPYQ